MNQQPAPIMHHTRSVERFRQHFAHPQTVREPAQEPQPHMTYLAATTHPHHQPHEE